MIHSLKFRIILFILVLTSIASSQEKADQENKSLLTEREMIDKSLSVLGFDDSSFVLKHDEIEINLITLQNDSTPFLYNWINNRKLWAITYKNISFNSLRGKSINDSNALANLNCLFDASNGKVIRFRAFLHSIDSSKYLTKSSTEIENQYKKTKIDFTGLPDEEPFPLLDILKTNRFDISEAEGFEAVYVNRRSKNFPESPPRWIITYYGMPKIITSPPFRDESGKFISKSKTVLITYNCTYDGISGKSLHGRGEGNPSEE